MERFPKANPSYHNHGRGKMGPSNNSCLLNTASQIPLNHDCGRKSTVNHHETWRMQKLRKKHLKAVHLSKKTAPDFLRRSSFPRKKNWSPQEGETNAHHLKVHPLKNMEPRNTPLRKGESFDPKHHICFFFLKAVCWLVFFLGRIFFSAKGWYPKVFCQKKHHFFILSGDDVACILETGNFLPKGYGNQPSYWQDIIP